MMGDEWIQRISRRRKIPYYFNTRTRETQWNEPSNAEKTCSDQKRVKLNSCEERNEGSPRKKANTLSSEPSTGSKSSPLNDCSSASKLTTSKKCDADTKSTSEKQECISEYMPRIMHPKKRSKRKKSKQSTSSDAPQKEFQETKPSLPPDKAEPSKGPPAKCARTVTTPNSERSEIIRHDGRNANTSSPKGPSKQKKESGGALHPKVRTAVKSVSQMEVDLPLSTEGKVLVVVDTNVLINSLHYLETIKGKTIEDLGDVMLTIPWMVMQELDLLKGPNCMAMTPLSSSARKALNFLHKNRTDPSIKGQSYHHFLKTVKENDVKETSDDKILHYCLQCKKKYPRNSVVLLSNDKNLCVKASFSGVPSSGDKDFMDEIKKQVRSHSRLSFSSDDSEVFSAVKEEPSSGRCSPEGAITCISPMECQSPGPFRNTDHTIQDLKTTVREESEKGRTYSPVHQNNARRNTPSPPVQQSLASGTNATTPALQSEVRNTPSPPVQQSHASRTNATSPALKSEARTNSDKQVRENERPSTSVAPSVANNGKADSKEKKIDRPLSLDPVAERKKKEREYTNQMLGFLKLALVIVLRHEMIESYTDHWLEIVHKKPPWSLLDALQCIKKHYIAVFGLLLGRSNAEKVDRLISIVEKIGEDDYFTSKQLESFRFAAKSILMPLNKHAKYKDITTRCDDDIKRVYHEWKGIIQEASQSSINSAINQAEKVPLRIADSELPQEKESVQETEDMCISPPATTSSNTPETEVQGAVLIKNREARREMEERREGDGMDHVTYSVLSVFEAIYIVLKYHRDVIVWSFKHLASGCPIEGLPTKEESLNYLSLALPLIEAIVHSLQRLIDGCIPDPLVCCTEVVESLRAYVQALKLDLDINGLHPEMLLQFILAEDNRERLVVGSHQLGEVLQQLHECRVTLCHF